MAGDLTKVFSAALHGVEAVEVEIEVNDGGGEIGVVIVVGLPDAAVRESRDRVVTALINSGFKGLAGRTTVNLAPADIKKEGPSFDLPIALGMISNRDEERRDRANTDDFCIVGELALNGAIRPVKGILSIALSARARGRRAIIVPQDNAEEASVVSGLDVYGAVNLREAYEIFSGKASPFPEPRRTMKDFLGEQTSEIDFSDVKGQGSVKRALEVAAAGGHNLLMIGPPGTGKSMLAKRLATILPVLTEEEAIETTKIHSISGLLEGRNSFVTMRPFRSPHHTISDAGLLGGGTNPGPGEVSLANNGVLFLDELPEFRRSTLEVMRQPLEDGKVTISRAAGTMTFPARFMLIAAMNPCPCGFFGDRKRECRCNPISIQRYRQRISGPLLDRIDIHVEVPLVDFKELSKAELGEPSAAIRSRVEQAREIQTKRYEKNKGVNSNSALTTKLMREHCRISPQAQETLEGAMQQYNFSARAHDRILKVARTIADLAASEDITEDHLFEAVQFRTMDRTIWV